MDTQSPSLFDQIRMHGNQLSISDEAFVRQQAVTALQNLAVNAAVTSITLDDLVRRGVKLSPQLAGLHLAMKMLAAGDSSHTLALEVGSFNLHGHCAELIDGRPVYEQAPAIAGNRHIPDTEPTPVAIEPTLAPVDVYAAQNVTSVDFKNRRKLH